MRILKYKVPAGSANGQRGVAIDTPAAAVREAQPDD